MDSRAYLGIDTSNYTTSCAIFQNEKIFHTKKLLPVKKGTLGLRQSDAVFSHIKAISGIFKDTTRDLDFSNIRAVGASVRPRDLDNSYMPCFLVGETIGDIISETLKVKLYTFSHQCGHIASAAYSANKLDLLKGKFIAFHVSGGTSEALLVTPDEENIIKTKIVAKTLDLHAGQVIDRTANLLGLGFPGGAELEKLALNSQKTFKINPCLKGDDCCLSGLENLCIRLKAQGENAEDIANYCISYILLTLDKMCENLTCEFGDIPILFSGGVMSNSIINKTLTKKYNAIFASPEFSSDNAAGIAILASIKYKMDNKEDVSVL